MWSCDKKQDKVNDGLPHIKRIMKAQEEAWNRGEIDHFMNGYLASDSLVFIGSKGLTFGFDKTLSNYKKSYPDKKAMGRLQFTNKIERPVGSTAYFVIGQWTLFRQIDTLSGHYSLLWEKSQGEWKIIADHSS